MEEKQERFEDKLQGLLGPKLALSPFQREQLARHWALVDDANRKMNLTAIRDEDTALEKHYLDSLYLLPHLKPGQKILDLGSGAGFPGIPLAIAQPEGHFWLLDSSAKRCRFLEECRQALNLPRLTVLCTRAEKAGQDKALRERFDLVLARAVAPLPVLLEFALPLVKPGGQFIAMKGPALDEELAAAENALEVLGAVLTSSEGFALPISQEQRRLAFFIKTAATPPKYPRREGMPEKRPL